MRRGRDVVTTRWSRFALSPASLTHHLDVHAELHGGTEDCLRGPGFCVHEVPFGPRLYNTLGGLSCVQ